jgi:sugar O-acyltransferase (sialic acid O-acetyltransferase NeuD family)
MRGERNLMSKVVVVGTGGMGREAAAWIADSGRGSGMLGFLDGDPGRHGSEVGGRPVLGDLDWLDGRNDVEVVVAIGSPERRRAVADQLAASEIPLATIVHPTAVVGPRTKLAPGAIICPGVLLTCDVQVGRAAIVNYGAMIGHDGFIGEYAFVAPGVHLAGNVTVGAEADVGIGASVIQGITVGDRAVVGAGAVVIRDVEPSTTVVGVPARPLEGR